MVRKKAARTEEEEARKDARKKERGESQTGYRMGCYDEGG